MCASFSATCKCRYGHSLVLVASQELRERALTPLTQSPSVDIPDVQYGLLEVVGCSRHHGAYRPYITTKYLKIDARSVYHHSKTLRKLGLITLKVMLECIGNGRHSSCFCVCVCVCACVWTSLQAERRNTTTGRSQVAYVIYLTRFSPPSGSLLETGSFEEHFCSMLESAPHRTIPLRTLHEKLVSLHFASSNTCTAKISTPHVIRICNSLLYIVYVYVHTSWKSLVQT